jgi:hypothetical protein
MHQIETLDDEDNDGMHDSYEEKNGLNASVNASVNDATGDLDGDTVPNVNEFLNATNPQSKDTAGDGFDDAKETAVSTDPTGRMMLWSLA